LSLSLVLLLAGGLSLRALQKSRAIDLGFNPSGVMTASYDLELQNYPAERRVAFRRELRSRLAALPGVTRVGVANTPPLGGTMVSTIVESTDSAGRIAESRAYLNGAGPGYFDVLHIPMARGRGFVDTDGPGSAPVAVVNETLARGLWGSAEPLGREVTLGRTKLQVVGVARDSKYDEATEDPRPFLYTSLDQAAQLDREAVIVRTASAPAALSNVLRATVHALDPALPVFELRTMEDLLRERADKERAISVLLGAFGVMALLLASLGLYGVMACAVTRRTREIGIRIALGATRSQVSSLIARDGLRLALTGVAIGGTLSLPMAYALGALLFGIQIADVAAFALTCGCLVGVAVFASWLPARRAARLDPVFALRTE
jgi:predicted permease